MEDFGSIEYEKFLSGDPAGFENVFGRYREGMILFILRYVGDLQIAEDISQDVFARIWLDRPRFSGRSLFKTWLYSLARNAAIDYMRKRRRTSPDVASVSDTEDAFFERAFAEERRRALHRALGELKPEYGRALYLCYFEEMPVREIAALEKKSPRQISDLIYNAKRALKAVITEREEYEILRRGVE